MTFLKTSLLTFLSFVCCQLQANENAHVHGIAVIQIAQENSELEAEFISPLMNLTGFEHQPETKEEHRQLKSALDKLKNAQSQFKFDGSECQSVSVTVSLPWDESEEKSERHHDHHGHDHEHQQAHQVHGDIHVHYSFNCQLLAGKITVDLGFIRDFPNIQHLQAEWFSDNGVGRKSLSHSQASIEL